MFASIRTYSVGPGQRDEVVRRVDEGWLDELRKQRGAMSYFVVATGDNELVSFTACQDEGTLGMTVEKSAEWVGSHLMEFDVALQREQRGQVVSHMG